MTFDEFTIHLDKMRGDFSEFFNADGPEIAGNIAEKKFKENFEKEGFAGAKWKEVQRRIPGSKAYKAVAKRHPADTQRKILSGRTGNLRNSINHRIEPGKAIVYSDTTYGAYHNEGAGNLPKRQFFGHSPELENAVTTALKKQLYRLIK